ncbi:ankyrin repeat domain-containing protein 26-like [Melopsittacus undulatus]|uniref:ankyrin repeat domain-containing protein 26-like n=1 Tax=Melopsittacus undulatus TaxID=13146 RepID=UPI00146E4DCB|nr:ankyrin repeat domain-containing protein 26-like [Melopsittacus undulatus]
MQGVVASSRESGSADASGQLPTATTASTAYDLREKNLGRLHRAAAQGDLAWLRRWRWWLKRVGTDKRDKQKRTPLHLACANGHVDVVKYLVQKNCQLNLVDRLKRSPLMTAVECRQEKCVAILLEHGADPNLADADGNTALHLAVLSTNTTVAGLLLEHNADIDAQNKDGHTPFHLAVSRHQEEMVEFLQKKGADRHAQDQQESTKTQQDGAMSNGRVYEERKMESKTISEDISKTSCSETDSEGGGLRRKVTDIFQKLEKESKNCTQIEAQNRDLQEQSSIVCLKSEILEESECQLKEEVAMRKHLIDTNMVDRRQVEQYKREVGDLSQKLEKKCKKCTLIEAQNRDLQEELSDVLLKCKILEKTERQLAREVVDLKGLLEKNTVDHSRMEQYKREMDDLSQKLEKEYKKYTQIEAENRDLQEKLSTVCLKLEILEESECQLKEDVAMLKQDIDTNLVDRSQVEQYKREVDDLSQKLKKESKKCTEIEAQNRDLQEQLSNLLLKCKILEESECQLKGDVAMRKHHIDTNMVDRSQMEQYKREVDDLSQKLKRKSKKCTQIEAQNRDLQEQLSAMCLKHKILEESECQLKEEVAMLKHHIDTNLVDRRQVEQYKKEVDDLSQKLEKESKKCTLIEAQNRDLQEQLSTMCLKGEILEGSERQLVNKVVELKYLLEKNMVDRSQMEQYKREVGDLSQKLEKESKKCTLIEAQDRDLQEKLSAMCLKCEMLEESECQLKEEVAMLKHRIDTNLVDRSQMEQYKREVDVLSQKLKKESIKCTLIEAQDRDLQEKLSAMCLKCEMLEESECQLKEEVAMLKDCIDTNLVDCSQVEQYKREVDDLSQKLKKKSKKCTLIEAQNRDLQEQLSTVCLKREILEKSERQLKGDVAMLKHHIDTNMVDRSQMEQYKREVEERAIQELSRKLEEGNLVLQGSALMADDSEEACLPQMATAARTVVTAILELLHFVTEFEFFGPCWCGDESCIFEEAFRLSSWAVC